MGNETQVSKQLMRVALFLFIFLLFKIMTGCSSPSPKEDTCPCASDPSIDIWSCKCWWDTGDDIWNK